MEKFYFEQSIRETLLETSMDASTVDYIVIALRPMIDRLFNLEDEVKDIKDGLSVLERNGDGS